MENIRVQRVVETDDERLLVAEVGKKFSQFETDEFHLISDWLEQNGYEVGGVRPDPSVRANGRPSTAVKQWRNSVFELWTTRAVPERCVVLMKKKRGRPSNEERRLREEGQEETGQWQHGPEEGGQGNGLEEDGEQKESLHEVRKHGVGHLETTVS